MQPFRQPEYGLPEGLRPERGAADQKLSKRRDYRNFKCRWCRKPVRICRRCDRGHGYCTGECRALGRKRSLRKAGRKYQAKEKGKTAHKWRQNRYRSRREKNVTHQGRSREIRARESWERRRKRVLAAVAELKCCCCGCDLEGPGSWDFLKSPGPGRLKEWSRSKERPP